VRIQCCQVFGMLRKVSSCPGTGRGFEFRGCCCAGSEKTGHRKSVACGQGQYFSERSVNARFGALLTYCQSVIKAAI
jgi:hypothetical protein